MKKDGSLKSPPADPAMLDEWLDRLNQLIQTVKSWSEELGWATRIIEKRMEDLDFDDYVAPALLLQQETVRLILEPISRTTIGTDGVVDLYVMPAYDDLAHLYFADGQWRLHYCAPGSTPTTSISDGDSELLNKESLAVVLSMMHSHAPANP